MLLGEGAMWFAIDGKWTDLGQKWNQLSQEINNIEAKANNKAANELHFASLLNNLDEKWYYFYR